MIWNTSDSTFSCKGENVNTTRNSPLTTGVLLIAGLIYWLVGFILISLFMGLNGVKLGLVLLVVIIAYCVFATRTGSFAHTATLSMLIAPATTFYAAALAMLLIEIDVILYFRDYFDHHWFTDEAMQRSFLMVLLAFVVMIVLMPTVFFGWLFAIIINYTIGQGIRDGFSVKKFIFMAIPWLIWGFILGWLPASNA